MDDAKLRAAAKLSEAAFNTEWLDQGGSGNPSHMGINYNYFKNVRFGLFSKKPDEGMNRMDNMTGMSVAQRLMKTQIRPEEGDKGELQSIEKGLSAFFTNEGKFRGWKNSLKEMGALLVDEVELHLQQQNDLLEEINKKTGLTGKLSHEFREEIMAASVPAAGLGISFDKLITSVSTLVAESGKFKLLSEDTINQMELASVFVGDMGEFAAMGKDFEKIGLGVRDMSREVQAAGHSALEMGLNARTTTKLLDENLRNLNSYGFKNGVAGLNRMVQQSVEFRMNMDQTFALADKVLSPEGALEVVANLQMIGGAFGDLNDPIKLMYMATNNVEGLQDALQGAAKTLVTFNQEQGRFEVTGANLRRAHEMAATLGVDFKELTNGAVAAMERTTAASDLMSTGLIMDNKDKEFLTNLAQMKDGKMVIEVPPDLRKQLGVSADNTAVALESMTQDQAKTLLEQRDAFKKLSTEEYARQQVSALQNINRDVSFIRAALRVGVGQVIGEAAEKYIGIDKDQISAESKKIRDILAGGIGNAQGAIVDAMNIQGLTSNPKGTVKGGATSATVPNYVEKEAKRPKENYVEKRVYHKIEHNFNMSAVSLDPFRRELTNDALLNSDPDSYLNVGPGEAWK